MTFIAETKPLDVAQIVRVLDTESGRVINELMVGRGCTVQVLAAGAPEAETDDIHSQRLRLVRATARTPLTSPGRMPRCMSTLAELAGVSRQTFTASVKLALERERDRKQFAGLRLLAEARSLAPAKAWGGR